MENELWYPGGETAFIGKMIRESADFSERVGWFTSLVSRSENLSPLEDLLARSDVSASKVIPMSQGNKKSRLLAWTFLSEKRRREVSEKYVKA